MSLDQSLVGRTFPPTAPYVVTEERVRAFAEAAGGTYPSAGRVPATFPIVMAFAAMNDFLDEVGVELSRIVHGDQRFAYERPIETGDELTAALEVAGLRQIGGNDILSTVSRIRDAGGTLVCTAKATLVHRAGTEEDA